MKSFHLSLKEEEYEQIILLKGSASVRQFLLEKALGNDTQRPADSTIKSSQIHEDLMEILMELNQLKASLSDQLQMSDLNTEQVGKLTLDIADFKQEVIKRLTQIQSKLP